MVEKIIAKGGFESHHRHQIRFQQQSKSYFEISINLDHLRGVKMESRTSKVNELCKRTGIGMSAAMKFLAMADYEMDLAVEIAEYYGIAVNKSYPIGRVIRNYWMNKAREEYW